MTFSNLDPVELHDRQVQAVTAAVAKLLVKLGPDGFTPEAIFEGAVRGASVQIIAAGSTSDEVADLLEEMASAFRELEKPSMRVVQ